jgi:hypothetical protein
MNAIKYFLDNQISEVGANSYAVEGNHDEHVVRYESDSDWNCDCPLSNGKEPFSEAMDCSHMQAVRLFVTKPTGKE